LYCQMNTLPENGMFSIGRMNIVRIYEVNLATPSIGILRQNPFDHGEPARQLSFALLVCDERLCAGGVYDRRYQVSWGMAEIVAKEGKPNAAFSTH